MFFVSDRVVLRRSSFSEYKSFSALIGLHVYSRRDDLRDFWWMSCRMARHIVIWCKNITEKLNPWVGYTHVTDDRQTDSYDGFAMPFVKLNMTVKKMLHQLFGSPLIFLWHQVLDGGSITSTTTLYSVTDALRISYWATYRQWEVVMYLSRIVGLSLFLSEQDNSQSCWWFFLWNV